MGKRNFNDLLAARWAAGQFVSLGLDPVTEKIERIWEKSQGRPVNIVDHFLERIVEATGNVVGAYKPNLAFFEGNVKYWNDHVGHLRWLIRRINQISPQVPVILDFKRGDIGETNRHSIALFDYLGADACTVNGDLGQETWQPLLDRPDKTVFVLCRTSNPGAAANYDQLVFMPLEEAQELTGLRSNISSSFYGWPFVKSQADSGYLLPKYEYIALTVAKKWNTNSNCGLVVGATAPEQLARVRQLAPDVTILIPGIGKQGGDLTAAVKNGMNAQKTGFVINSSSSLLYASSGPDFAQACAERTVKLGEHINTQRDEEAIPC